MVCYDIASPMHPEILTPVDCWPDPPSSSRSRYIKRGMYDDIIARHLEARANPGKGPSSGGPGNAPSPGGDGGQPAQNDKASQSTPDTKGGQPSPGGGKGEGPSPPVDSPSVGSGNPRIPGGKSQEKDVPPDNQPSGPPSPAPGVDNFVSHDNSDGQHNSPAPAPIPGKGTSNSPISPPAVIPNYGKDNKNPQNKSPAPAVVPVFDKDPEKSPAPSPPSPAPSFHDTASIPQPAQFDTTPSHAQPAAAPQFHPPPPGPLAPPPPPPVVPDFNHPPPSNNPAMGLFVPQARSAAPEQTPAPPFDPFRLPPPPPPPPPFHSSRPHSGFPPGPGNNGPGNSYRDATVWDEGSDSDNEPDNDNTEPNLSFFYFAPDSPLEEILSAPALPAPTWDDQQQIFFNLDCRQSPAVCGNMSYILNLAGWYISQV